MVCRRKNCDKNMVDVEWFCSFYEFFVMFEFDLLKLMKMKNLLRKCVFVDGIE